MNLSKNTNPVKTKRLLTELRNLKMITLDQIEKYAQTAKEIKEFKEDGKPTSPTLFKLLGIHAANNNLPAIKMNHVAFNNSRNGYESDVVLVKKGLFQVDPTWIWHTVNENGVTYDVLNEKGRKVIRGEKIPTSNTQVKAPHLSHL